MTADEVAALVANFRKLGEMVEDAQHILAFRAERRRRVVRRLCETHNQREVAALLGITQQRVAQLRKVQPSPPAKT